MWTLIIIGMISAGQGGGVDIERVEGFQNQDRCMAAATLLASGDASPQLRMAKTVVKTYCVQK